MKIWIKRGLIGLGALLALSGISLWLLARSWRLEFEETVRQLEQSGAAVRASQLAPPAVPDSENAALLIAEAALLLEEFKDDEAPDWDELSDEKADLDVLKGYAAKRQAALDKLAEALRRPRCRFPVDYSQGILADLSHIPQLTAFARALNVRAVVALRTGDPAAALRDLKLTLRLSECLAGDPLVISQLVRYVIYERAFELLKGDRLVLPAEEWRALAGAFEARSFQGDLVAAFQMERASSIDLIKSYLFKDERSTGGRRNSEEGMGLNFFAAKGGTHHLRVMGRAIDLVRQPYAAARPGELAFHRELESSLRWHEFLSRVLRPAILRTHENEARMEAAQRLAAAFCRIKAEGRAPEALDLTDPCSGKPLLYARERSGFTLRSVGPNQKDDGGADDDIVLKASK